MQKLKKWCNDGLMKARQRNPLIVEGVILMNPRCGSGMECHDGAMLGWHDGNEFFGGQNLFARYRAQSHVGDGLQCHVLAWETWSSFQFESNISAPRKASSIFCVEGVRDETS